MVHTEAGIYIGQNDPFNFEKRRNIKNTDKNLYNCGGYALGTFSWYCPNAEEDDPFGLWNFIFSPLPIPELMERVTASAVEQMLIEFADLRVITTLAEVKSDEYPIAFRVSHDGDFHYVKRARNGHWYHKLGSDSRICRMAESVVFSKDWGYRYDGRIVLLAKKF